ncbi:MAG TPA: DivIVA domain-containing protein [Actinomycetota bacterium]|nr:DivIVA domain-containing protein [Actinomycetota bacterium]
MDPEEIENRQFLVQLRGYARDEVESFREEVAQEIKILRKQLTKATSDLSHANSELGSLRAQLAEVTAQLAQERSRPAPEPEPRQDAEPNPPEDRASMFRMVGQETERILLAAEEAAEQIHEQAQKESAELMADTRLRVERSLAEFEAARRAAEEDFAGIRDSRSMVASQLEDIRRRLEETISRLRVPVELPGSKPASRFRPQADPAERAAAPDRRQMDIQGQQRQQREMEAARELQARQTAHRGDAERRGAELKAVQVEAEQRARADERQARERAAAEAAARKAQQAAELQAAVAAAQEADRLKAVREAERGKAAEAASAAVKARADEQAAATARRDAERAEAEKAKAEADRAAKAEAERAARAEAARAAELVEKKKRQAEKEQAAKAERKAAESKSSTQQAEPPAPKPAGEGGSSLDELLAEIRRKREEEERQAAPSPDQPAEQPVAKAAGASGADELARRSEALGDLPAQTARRLKRLLQEEHNELLDRLRTQRGKGTLEDNLASHSEQLGRFVSGLTDALSRAFAEGGKAAGGVGNSDASAAITKLVTRQVLNPLRNEISKALEAGLQAEDSAAALSERANDVFRVWKGVRTQLLGEGIAYSAYHHGMIDAWGSRTGAKKQWVFSGEEQECPNDVCRRNSEAGDVVLKAPFPSGHLAPPAHGGCNCTLKGA